MYNEGAGDGCPTKDPQRRPAPPVRQRSLYSGMSAYPCRLLLCYGLLLVVSKDEVDDELEEVAILTEKPRPQTRWAGKFLRNFCKHIDWLVEFSHNKLMSKIQPVVTSGRRICACQGTN